MNRDLRCARLLKKVYEVDPLICPRAVFDCAGSRSSKIPRWCARFSITWACGTPEQRPPLAEPIAVESIGGILPQAAEDPYPYDLIGWDSDEPA